MSSERDNVLPADQLPSNSPEGVTERAPEPYPVSREPLPAPVGRWRLGTFPSLLFVAVLVVVAVGLVVMVSERMRAEAGRMSCSNSLKQISSAIHGYTSTFNDRLPPQSQDIPGIGPASFFFTILPWIEADVTYGRARGTGACWNAGNSSTVIRNYLCPNDTSHANGLAPNGWAVTSYSTNALLFASVVTTDPQTGKTSCRSRYKLGHLPDGTSVVAIVERYGVYPASGYTSLWAAPCGGSWGWPETSHSYGMWSTGPPEVGATPGQARYDLPNSGHRTVQVMLINGWVRTMNPNLGAETWLRALTPDDLKPLGPDWE